MIYYPEDGLKNLVQNHIPPPLLADVLSYTIKRLAIYHKQEAQPHIISALINVFFVPII